MLNTIALFVSTYVLVFALGFQSRNVNTHQYVGAFFTSFAIGGGQLVLYKLAPNANTQEIAAYLAGGPLGIVSAMWVHARLAKRRG